MDTRRSLGNVAPRIITKTLLVGCLCLTGAFSVYSQAVITGRVDLPKASQRPPARVRYSPQAIVPGPAEPPTAVVYLEGHFPARPDPPPPLKLPQKDLQFVESLVPVRVGTTVVFPNHDEIYHNVFSYSKPKRFDLGRYQKNEAPPSQLFDQPGLVKLYCEIHEHMRATVLVLETPYFAKTDTNGVFRLEGLPAGTFALKAWLDEKTVLQQSVELQTNSALTVNFSR